MRLYDTLVTVKVSVPATSPEAAEARAFAMLAASLNRTGCYWEQVDTYTQEADIVRQWEYMDRTA
jgi:hypothetical protein